MGRMKIANTPGRATITGQANPIDFFTSKNIIVVYVKIVFKLSNEEVRKYVVAFFLF